MSLWIQVLIDYRHIVSIGAVIHTLALFVFYHLLFFSQYRFRNGIDEKAKFIGLCPNHFFQGIVWHRLKIICAVAVGGSVSPGTSNSGAEFVQSAFSQVF